MKMNLLLIIVAVLLVIKVIGGFKRGMVREIISLVSLVIVCAVAGLAVKAISSYHHADYFQLIVVIIILAAIGIVHHLLSIIFFSAKVVTKLPVIHMADKILGIAFGALEVVVLLWTLYCFVMTMSIGPIGSIIETYTRNSEILTLIYQKNLLAHWIGI